MAKAKKSKPLKLNLTVEGVNEFEQSLIAVQAAFSAFRVTADTLQEAVDRLNSVEVKVTTEKHE